MNYRKPGLKLRFAADWKLAVLSLLLMAAVLAVLEPVQARANQPALRPGVIYPLHREVVERLTPIDIGILPVPPTAELPPTAPPRPSPIATAEPTPDALTAGNTELVMAASKIVRPTSDGVGRLAHIPVLMYHYISDPPKGADSLRRDLSVPGSDFELQLRYLANEGYHSVHLQDVVLNLQRGTRLPEKPIVLTFDDGYKDAFTVAFPLLKKYGFTATFFVFTKPIDEENRDYLSWHDVELMSAAGMEFGSHSYSHPDLRGKPNDVLAKEIKASKAEIEDHIRRPASIFCYPSGALDRRVAAAVKEAGYWAAVTTQQGIDHQSGSLFEITRIRVRGNDGLERFDALLNREW